MSYKLCDTCNKVSLKGLNLFSENNEEQRISSSFT